jgi:chromosome segregation ATPase
MNTELSLSIIEIIVLMIGAITLGITIHFFIVSRKALKEASPQTSIRANKELEQRKLRFLNDIEWKDKEITELRRQLEDERSNTEIYTIEAEELRRKNKLLAEEMERLKRSPVKDDASDYVQQFREAQSALKEYQQKMSALLEHADSFKDNTVKQQETERENERLTRQVEDLQIKLSEREKELGGFLHKHELTTEMSSMLDNAYSEFSILQEKINKLETQVSLSKRQNMEYEDLKEENFRMGRELQNLRNKHNAATRENKELLESLTEVEDKLREANFQRQQLQKRVAYLEDINNDMQSMAEANKNLESQIKRIGELESKLHMLAEERDGLAPNQDDE